MPGAVGGGAAGPRMVRVSILEPDAGGLSKVLTCSGGIGPTSAAVLFPGCVRAVRGMRPASPGMYGSPPDVPWGAGLL